MAGTGINLLDPIQERFRKLLTRFDAADSLDETVQIGKELENCIKDLFLPYYSSGKDNSHHHQGSHTG